MWNGVITDVGNALLNRWAEGEGILTVSGARGGTGFVAESELRKQTRLMGAKQDLSIVYTDAVEKGNRFKIQFSAVEPGASYVVNQLGIYAKLDDEAEELLAIYQDRSGIMIPSSDEMPDFNLAFYIVIAMDNAGELSVKIDSNAYLTMNTMDEILEMVERRLIAPLYSSTIPLEGWNYAEKTVQIDVLGIAESDTAIVDIVQTGDTDTDSYIRGAWGLITRIVIGDDMITVYADEIPEVEIPIQIKVVR